MATTATPYAGTLATPDPNRRPLPPTQVVAGPPPTQPSLTLAGPSESTTDVQDSVDEVTPTPSAPRALASSNSPPQQALVVAGAPIGGGGRGGGPPSGGTGADASNVEGGSSFTLPILGTMDSNLVLLLSLLAALGLPAVAIGGRLYQIRRE